MTSDGASGSPPTSRDPLAAPTGLPTPQRPSRRFVWAWRTALVLYVGFFAVLDVRAGMPNDPYLQWRAGMLGLGCVVSGAAALGFWTWAGRPRLTWAEQSTIGPAIGSDQRRRVQGALHRRPTALPHDLRPEARALVELQESAVLTFRGALVFSAVQLTHIATTAQFPPWLSLGIHGGSVLVWSAILTYTHWLRSQLDHLDEHTGTERTSNPDQVSR